MSNFLDQFSFNSPYNNEEPIHNNNSPYISNSQACTPELKSHQVATDILESPRLFSPNCFLNRDFDFDGFSPLPDEGMSSNIEDLDLLFDAYPVSHSDTSATSALNSIGSSNSLKRTRKADGQNPPAKRQCYKESEKQEIEEEVIEILDNQTVFSEEVNEMPQTSQRLNRGEREKLILDKVISNPFLIPKNLHKELKSEGIKMSIKKIEKTWRKHDLTDLEKRIEKLRAYYRKNPQMTLTGIQKEALKNPIKTREELEVIIRNIAIQNPFLSAEGAELELTEQGIQVTNRTITGIWLRYGLTTIDKRVEALRKYYKIHPKAILTDVQKKALEGGVIKTPEELEVIIQNIALENPHLSAEQAVQELQKQHILVKKHVIEKTWSAHNLNTRSKRVEALRKLYESHPQIILNDIQKTALEVPIKYLQNVAPKFENITLQSTFGSISDGSLIGPTSASEFMESPRDLTSSDLPQSEESENSIGEGAHVPPIFLHSFISPYISNSQPCTPELKSHQVATDILESPRLFSPNCFLNRDFDFDGFSPLLDEGMSSNIEDLDLLFDAYPVSHSDTSATSLP